MRKVLEIKNLSLWVKKSGIQILKNISFGIERGEVVGIIGESGSGKSMTCMAILQLLNKRIFNINGNVIFNNLDLMKMGKERLKIIGKDISLVMQNPMTAFNPTLRIGTQITETVRTHNKMSGRQAYKMGIEALEQIHLDRTKEIMHSYPHMLSGGMLQRIMLAITLMLEPKIVIADEATTALDVNTQAMVLEHFSQMKQSNISLIVVTHDFGVIAKLADYVIVMKDGEIVEQANVFDIFDKPKHEYTKQLLDARILTGGR